MSEDREQKTEQPTERRLRELRKQGHVVFSRDLVGAATFAGATAVLFFCARAIGGAAFDAFRLTLSDLSAVTPTDALLRGAAFFAQVSFPTLAACLLLAIVAGIAQVGLPNELSLLREGRPGFNPLAKIRRIFGKDAVLQLLAQIMKLAIVASIFAVALGGQLVRLGELASLSLFEAMSALFLLMKKLAIVAVVTFVALGAFDYLRGRRRMMADARMTKEEVKREAKEEQGSPQLKSRRRALARQLSKQQTEAEVRRADVVITNPTHYAVALRYDSKKMRAPRVVAKGVDHLAARIKEIAAERGVPIVENVPLARTLHAQVRVGRDVPVELYRAVAEVLAFVYKQRSRTRHGVRT
ncbi:MAG: EscU/YscU/HrcU family type III secretion system export apparatus switch protein [Deltaproteobacteria bacterium]|nr:EscU/YscU/HrcU family type III secretion system export apparatus switch protein [Deltaproteobacteria bacterium]